MTVNELGLNIYSTKNDLSIYVHIPFCSSKCEYCSFVSMVASPDDKKRYFNALVSEIKIRAKQYNSTYSVASIYIGGGTPSCMDYYFIRDLLSCLYKNFAVKNSAEITIELNPNSADANKIREYILSGINRFSIGLQSTSSKILKEMGRTHTVEDYEKVVNIIRGYGIKNISTDVIIGYPHQKVSDIKDTINYLLKMDIPHISVYMLQVEEGTKLKTLVDQGLEKIPDEDATADMYETASNMLLEAGYERYELSNFAKNGYESYHNKIYWARKEYLGFGLAAHSYMNKTRFANTEDINKYVTSLENNQEIAVDMSKELSLNEQKEEAVMLGLRTKLGLDTDAYQQEFGSNILAEKKDVIASLIKKELIILTNDNHLVATNAGFLVLNKIILELCD